MLRFSFGLVAVLIVTSTTRADDPPKKEGPATAEKIWQALKTEKELDIKAESLEKLGEHVTTITGVHVEIDAAMSWAYGLGAIAPGGGMPVPFALRGAKAPIGETLSRSLTSQGLTFVVLYDRVMITSAERANLLVLSQRVVGTVKDQPLNKTLAEMTRKYGVSITIDPAAAKLAETPVSMQMLGNSLESTVHVLAISAGLYAARLDNAMFVTTPEKAKLLPQKLLEPAPAANPWGVLGNPWGVIGNPPLNLIGFVGVMGNVGLAGGAGGQGGLGQIGGGAGLNLGVGGALGAQGGNGAQGGKPMPMNKKGMGGSSWLSPRYDAYRLVHAAPIPDKAKATEDSAAERIRKELNSVISFEVANLPLPQAMEQIKTKMGFDIVLDRAAIVQFLMERGGDVDAINGMMINGKFNKVPLRRALRSALGEHGLTYVIVGEHLLITTETMAQYRLMRQPTTLDFDKAPFADAVKKLARDTALNIVLDPRTAKEAQEKVSLQAEDVPLTTALKLLAEQVGLKVFVLDNVVLVTTKQRAAELREDPDFQPRSPMDPRIPIEGPAGPGMPGFPPALPPRGGMGMGGGGAPPGAGAVPLPGRVEDPMMERMR